MRRSSIGCVAVLLVSVGEISKAKALPYQQRFTVCGSCY